jgi:ribosomal protein S18 acetylase RimI-like enzyme
MDNHNQANEQDTACATVRQVNISDSKSLKKFVQLERILIGSNPLFISEINSVTKKRLAGYSKFYSDMQYALFVVSNGLQDKARCAAFINRRYQKAKDEAVGFIGYFAAASDAEPQVSALFDRAETWLRENNVTRVITPFNGSALLGMALLSSAFHEEPMFPYGWHPPYYQQYLLNTGYNPTYPLWVYTVDFSSDKYLAVAQRTFKNSRIKVRPIDKKRWDSDLKTFCWLFNRTLKEEWEIHPYTIEEFQEIFDPYKLILDPRLLLFAEVEDKLAGFCWGVGDLNPLIRSFKGKMGPVQIIKLLFKVKRYQRAGVLAGGVLPEYKGTGTAQALITTLYKRFEEQGLKEAFYFFVNESNTQSRRFAEAMGGAGRVLYHCYDKRLQ